MKTHGPLLYNLLWGKQTKKNITKPRERHIFDWKELIHVIEYSNVWAFLF